MGRKLKNLRVNEVSLVDKPANLRPFMFIKSEDGETDFGKWASNELAHFAKDDDDGNTTHIIANEGGLNWSGNQVEKVDVNELVAEVVSMLDVPTMIAKAADAVRAELGTDMSPDDVVQMFSEALAEAG